MLKGSITIGGTTIYGDVFKSAFFNSIIFTPRRASGDKIPVRKAIDSLHSTILKCSDGTDYNVKKTLVSKSALSKTINVYFEEIDAETKV